MPLKTTVIGSYPMPSYFHVPSWFTDGSHHHCRKYTEFLKEGRFADVEFRKLSDQALKEVLDEQAELGIDVVTDGELERENYIWHLCRHLKGFNFEDLEEFAYRNGACVGLLPEIVGPVDVGDSCDIYVKQWLRAQAISSKPVKVTVPGPLTIMGTTNNKFYKDEKQLSLDLAAVVNMIFKKLVEAGCRHIQLDEPVFMREVEKSLDFGIDHASKCIEGIGSEVMKSIHLCCGYPNRLDQEDYLKAEPEGYFKLADGIDEAGFDEISIEDAHRRNDLSLLAHFKKSKVILGSLAIAKSDVETVSQIRARLEDALHFIPDDRLVVAPDCGLAYLPHDVMREKMANMVEAARSIP